MRSRIILSCDVVIMSGVFLPVFVAKILATSADSLTNRSNISKHEFHLVLTACVNVSTSPSFFHSLPVQIGAGPLH